MKYAVALLVILVSGLVVRSQIPSAPPHTDSPEEFKHKWVFDVMRGCKKQDWHDKSYA